MRVMCAYFDGSSPQVDGENAKEVERSLKALTIASACFDHDGG